MLVKVVYRILLFFFAQLFLVNAQVYPLHDDGLNDVVQWDHYSLKINGERLLIWSGEFHYWRIPVPNLWKDLMYKIKALGFNTFSVYGNWAYHEPTQGNLVFDDGAHNIEPIFEYAKEIGMYILFRPGPYVNAEANAGGFPAWVTTGAFGPLRDNTTAYTEAWTPYMAKISSIVSKYTVVKGGNVILYQIENEFASEFIDPILKIPYYPSIDYMENLEAVARQNGIDIPTTTNAPGTYGRSWSKDYSNFGGEQDIYGLDSYPQCWTCNKSVCEQYGVYSTFTTQDYEDHFDIMSPTQPSFLPEFQGGSFNPWGGTQGGCLADMDTDFVNVYNRDNIAQRVTMQGIYMVYGGTNWGGLGFPGVATSYDYSSPIQESRQLDRAKYSETKILGLQLRVSRDLTKTEQIGRGNASYTNNAVIYVTENRNPDTNGAFYIVRHEPSNLTTTDAYKLNINTSLGSFTVPQSFTALQLIGHESKIMVTDYDLTNGRSIIYSTAEVLQFSTVNANSPLLVLWVPSGGQGEILLKGVRGGQAAQGTVSITSKSHNTKLVSFQRGASTQSVVQFDDGLRILILDRTLAYKTWAPTLTADPFAPDSQTVVVTGPYLVRSIAVNGATVALTGDVDSTTTLEVFGPSNAGSITWNSRPVPSKKTHYGSLIAVLQGPNTSLVKIGSFTPWKVADGLPERLSTYDDSKWTAANHMTTASYYPPKTLPVLYAEEYGLPMGPILWRGRFSSAGSPSGVYLSVQGGTSFGYSVYLNGHFLSSWAGSTAFASYDLTIPFNGSVLARGSTENVLLVAQDHTGKDELGDALVPRGILAAQLLSGSTLTPSNATSFTSWKVAGQAGAGASTLLDPIRGPLNEGGLHGERLGWHLPGFDDRSWRTASLAGNGAFLSMPSDGMTFFRTTISTFVPKGLDAMLAIEVTDPGTTKDFRMQLYVNGYQYGRFFSAIGSQIEFPVPPGVLDYSGQPNTIGVALWAQDGGGAEVGIALKVLKVVESSFDPMDGTGGLRPVWSDRSQFY